MIDSTTNWKIIIVVVKDTKFYGLEMNFKRWHRNLSNMKYWKLMEVSEQDQVLKIYNIYGKSNNNMYFLSQCCFLFAKSFGFKSLVIKFFKFKQLIQSEALCLFTKQQRFQTTSSCLNQKWFLQSFSQYFETLWCFTNFFFFFTTSETMYDYYL